LSRGARHPILDGNVKRVLARYHAVNGWPGQPAVARELWTLADGHTPERDVAAYTQAIMDLGATICTRGKPRCTECPVESGCDARAKGTETELPAPRPKRARRQETVTVLVIENHAGEVLLERRPPTGIWGGLLSFPELTADETAAGWCDRWLAVAPESERGLDAINHGFTHFDLRLEPVLIEVRAHPSVVLDQDRWLWYNRARPLPGGIPAPIAKLLEVRAEPDTRQTA
jgi:A/G-specific adenine glycosylase